jgi:hypothetical protein
LIVVFNYGAQSILTLVHTGLAELISGETTNKATILSVDQVVR